MKERKKGWKKGREERKKNRSKKEGGGKKEQYQYQHLPCLKVAESADRHVGYLHF